MRALAALLLVLALAGCGGADEDAAPATTTPAEEPVALADFRGEPVLVNVWSSW